LDRVNGTAAREIYLARIECVAGKNAILGA
jgi:hypothetical protein